MQALNLSAGPHSLEYPRSPPRPEAAANPSILSQVFLKIGGYYSKESTLMRAAEGLYACVTEHATQPTLLQGERLLGAVIHCQTSWSVLLFFLFTTDPNHLIMDIVCNNANIQFTYGKLLNCASMQLWTSLMTFSTAMPPSASMCGSFSSVCAQRVPMASA